MAKSKSQKKPRPQNKKQGDARLAKDMRSKSDSSLNGESENEASTSVDDVTVKAIVNPTTPRPVLFKLAVAVFVVWLIFLAYVAYIVLSQG